MAALKAWPSTPHSWLLPWTIWRYRGAKPGERPPEAHKEVPKYAWEFLQWSAWRRKGAAGPRPSVAPKIPQWGWNLLKQLNIAVPIAPPPPPPPPANPIPANSWKLKNPLVFTAWGWRTDSDFRNVEVIGARMAEAKVGTVALQIGMFNEDVPDRLRAFGFDIALWGEADSRDEEALNNAEADGYIPQIEGIYQYANAIRNLEAGYGAGLSLSTVTTLAGLETYMSRPDGTPDGERTTVEVEELIDAGLTHAFIECYTGDMQPLNVSLFMHSAKSRGIYHANPTAGLAGRTGINFATYEDTGLDDYGRQIGVYLAEPMRPNDWVDLKNL